MKIFLDTNVLISNYLWGGACGDVFDVVIAGHHLVVGETVLDEVAGVLGGKFSIPAEDISAYQDILTRHKVIPRPEEPYALSEPLDTDLLILASAVDADSDVLVTGDKAFRSVDEGVPELDIRTPREFLDSYVGG